jgi:hypothetical protein
MVLRSVSWVYRVGHDCISGRGSDERYTLCYLGHPASSPVGNEGIKRPGRIWEDNSRMDLMGIGWIHLGQHILGFDSRRGLGIFLYTTVSIPTLVQWVPEVLSSVVKWSGREADHLRPSSAEVKNAWSCTSTPQYAFTVWCLVKHRTKLHMCTAR